jgi:hypothetical protein
MGDQRVNLRQILLQRGAVNLLSEGELSEQRGGKRFMGDQQPNQARTLLFAQFDAVFFA